MASRRQIRFRRHNLGRLIDIGLSPSTEPESQAIQVLVRARGGVIRRRQGEVDPVHAVLGGKQRDLDQGGKFVARVSAEFVNPAATLSFHAPLARTAFEVAS